MPRRVEDGVEHAEIVNRARKPGIEMQGRAHCRTGRGARSPNFEPKSSKCWWCRVQAEGCSTFLSAVNEGASRGVQRQPLQHSCICSEGYTPSSSSIGWCRRPEKPLACCAGIEDTESGSLNPKAMFLVPRKEHRNP